MNDVVFFSAMTALATAISALYQAISHRMKREMNGPAFDISHIQRRGDFLVCMVSVIPVSYHFRIARITCNGKGIARTRLDTNGRLEFVPEHAHSSRLDVDVQVRSTATSSRHSYPFELSIRLRKTQSKLRISFHRSDSFFAVRNSTHVDISSIADDQV